MDAGRRHETSRSETKDFIPHSIRSSQSISVFWLHLPWTSRTLIPTGRCEKGQMTPAHSLGWSRSPKLMEPISFITRSKYVFPCSGGKHYLYLPKNFQRCLLWNILEMVVSNKSSWFLCLQDMQKCKKPRGNGHQHSSPSYIPSPAHPTLSNRTVSPRFQESTELACIRQNQFWKLANSCFNVSHDGHVLQCPNPFSPCSPSQDPVPWLPTYP